MERNCIICKQNFKPGQIAPENSSFCIECENKGYKICSHDKRIFNVNEKKECFVLEYTQTLVLFDDDDLLKDLTEKFRIKSIIETDFCSNECFNLWYIQECIGYLRMTEYYSENKASEEGRKKFENYKPLIENKIQELEQLKEKYSKKSK